jgi:hypothetical protein
MKTITSNLSNKNTVSRKQNLMNEINAMAQEAVKLLKYTYLVLVLVLVCITVIELKHTYQIDIFPGIDTPFDNVYYAQKDQMDLNLN